MNCSFKKLVTNHREATKSNTSASGIIEVRGEREILLDDIVLAMNEADETRPVESEERTYLYQRLSAAGEEIRTRSVSRMSSSTPPDTTKPRNGTPASQPRKRVSAHDSDDE